MPVALLRKHPVWEQGNLDMEPSIRADESWASAVGCEARVAGSSRPRLPVGAPRIDASPTLPHSVSEYFARCLK